MEVLARVFTCSLQGKWLLCALRWLLTRKTRLQKNTFSFKNINEKDSHLIKYVLINKQSYMITVVIDDSTKTITLVSGTFQ
jgi:competence CoiA-like predicted nuclease